MIGITFLAGIVLTAMFAYHLFIDRKNSEHVANAVIASGVGIFLSFGLGAVVAGVGQEVTQDKSPVRWGISEVNGEYITTGVSGEYNDAVYYYNINSGDGVRLREADANITTIHKTDGEAYVLKWCDDWDTVPEWIHWPFNAGEGDDRYNCSSHVIDRIEIYVPEAS